MTDNVTVMFYKANSVATRGPSIFLLFFVCIMTSGKTENAIGIYKLLSNTYWQKETGKWEKDAHTIALERKKGRKGVSFRDAQSNCRLIAAEGFLSQKKVKEARCNSSRSFSVSNQSTRWLNIPVTCYPKMRCKYSVTFSFSGLFQFINQFQPLF